MSNRKRWGVRAWLAVCALVLATAGTAAGADLFTSEYASPAPADYVVESAETEGEAVDGVLTLQATVRVRLFRDEWVRVPLLGAGAAVTEATVEGAEPEDAFLQRDARATVLVAKHQGAVTVRLSLAARTTDRQGAREAMVPLVRALAARTRIVVPAENIQYSLEPAVDASKETLEDGRTAVLIYGAGADAVRLRWTPQPRLADLEPLVFVDHEARVVLERGSIRTRSLLAYSALQGTVQTLTLALPAGTNLLAVRGDGVRRWDTAPADADDAGERLTVELARPIEGTHELEIVTEAALGDLPTETEIRLPQALGVKREKGRVSVTALKGLKVEPGESEGATQIDVTEFARGADRPRAQVLNDSANGAMPNAMGVAGARPSNQRAAQQDAQVQMRAPAPAPAADLAFRFLGRPMTIRVRAAEVAPKVTAELSARVAASRESLRTRTAIRYDIREAGVFRFRYSIPEGLKLLDVQCRDLNTWQVEGETLTVDLRAKAEGAFVVALETEQPVADEADRTPLLTPRLLDVERETGHVAVTTRAGTKVELAGAPTGGAVQIDPGELPPELRPEAKTAELAFRYIRHPYAIALAIGAVEPEVHVVNHSLLEIEERELRLETRLAVDVRKSGIFELRLAFPNDLRLADDVRGPHIEDWRIDAAAEELVLSFQSKVSGKMEFLVRAEKTVETLDAGLDFPRVVCRGVKKETGFLALRTPLAIRMTAPSDAFRGLNPIAPPELPEALRQRAGDEVALAFKFLKPEWDLRIATERIRPVVNAVVTSRVELSSTLETTVAWVDYDIRHAGADTFYLRLPARARAVTIEGEDIKDRSPVEALPPDDGAPAAAAAPAAPRPEGEAAAPDERPIWRVVLQKKVKGELKLHVSFERSMEGAGGAVAYEGIEALRVQREEGYVSFVARTNVEVTQNRISGAYPIDVRQIPDWRALAGETPAIWAFQYLSHPYELVIGVTKHDDVPVVTAVAEMVWFQTVVGRDGQATTDVWLMMRNNNQQYLNVRLPEGATIWGATVNAEVVNLAEEKDTRRTLIPIVGASVDGKPFQVTLRYEEQLGALGQWGGVHLDAPALNIPVMRCLWEVYVPQEYDLVSVGGNMSRLTTREEYGLLSTYEESRRMLEQSAREWKNINQQLQTAQGRNKARSAAQSLDTGAAPTGGKRRYRFEKTMALDVGERDGAAGTPPVRLRTTFMRDAFNLVLRVVLVLGFVAFAAWLRSRWAQGRRIALYGGLMLFFFVLDTLAPAWYPGVVLVCFVMSALGL
ncbi:MAG: hypothetical protein ACOCX4_03545, partial [Planctomycetota bacterium]